MLTVFPRRSLKNTWKDSANVRKFSKYANHALAYAF